MSNRGLETALVAVGAAQVMKLPIHYCRTGKWDWKQLFGSGGMPSSHSSGVSALAAYTATKYGMKTPVFAIASMLGIIVMYDAMNIRRHAGEIAIQVNDLDEDVERLTGNHPGLFHKKRRSELKEALGHHPSEVAAGALLGVLLGYAGAVISE